MLAWPLYYSIDLKNNDVIKQIDEVKVKEDKAKSLKDEKFMNTFDYFKNYSDIMNSKHYVELYEKYVLAESARVTK